jgi:hypothetical protein
MFATMLLYEDVYIVSRHADWVFGARSRCSWMKHTSKVLCSVLDGVHTWVFSCLFFLGNGEGFTIHTKILGGVFAGLPEVGVGSRYTLFWKTCG